MNAAQFNEFIDYVLDFYNPKDGVFPIQGLTRDEVEIATQIRINSVDENSPFESDSFDREQVRDIIISMRKR